MMMYPLDAGRGASAPPSTRSRGKLLLSPKQTLHKPLTPDPGRDLRHSLVEARPVYSGLYQLSHENGCNFVTKILRTFRLVSF